MIKMESKMIKEEVFVRDMGKLYREEKKWWKLILDELKQSGVRAKKGRVYSSPIKKSNIHFCHNNKLDGELYQWCNGHFILRLPNRNKLEFYKKILSKSKANWSIEIS